MLLLAAAGTLLFVCWVTCINRVCTVQEACAEDGAPRPQKSRVSMWLGKVPESGHVLVRYISMPWLVCVFGAPVGKGRRPGYHASFGEADKPYGVHWVWEEVYYQCETGTAGLGEREETVLYPTTKFMVECVASLHSLVVSSLISWGVNEPGQTLIIQKKKKKIKNIFFSFSQRTKQ